MAKKLEAKKIIGKTTARIELTFLKDYKLYKAGETHKIGYFNARYLIAQSQRLKENGFIDLKKVDFEAMQLEK